TVPPQALKRWRRMTKMKTSEGTIRTKPPAKRKGSGESLRALSTWAGRVRLETVRMLAAKTSFQERTKVKMLAGARPGRASGRATFANAPNGVQPRVSA